MTTITVQKSAKYKILLKEHGSKATPGRVDLLFLLEKARKPLSVAEIAQHLSGSLDQANIYRSLEALSKVGLIRPVNLMHGHVDYEYVHEGDHHHHLVCRTCGEIEDVPEYDLKPIEQYVLTHSKKFSRIDEHALEFFGICKKCA